MSDARKNDSDKVRADLLPADALLGVTQVLTFGAKKYSARNWEQGLDWGRLSGALMRHLLAWMSGHDVDEESGLSHLDHLACCALMLSASVKRGIGTDDRKVAP